MNYGINCFRCFGRFLVLAAPVRQFCHVRAFADPVEPSLSKAAEKTEMPKEKMLFRDKAPRVEDRIDPETSNKKEIELSLTKFSVIGRQGKSSPSISCREI